MKKYHHKGEYYTEEEWLDKLKTDAYLDGEWEEEFSKSIKKNASIWFDCYINYEENKRQKI